MGVRLPAEYQEVEYLETDSDSYILTDYHPSHYSTFVIEYSTQIGWAFGCRDGMQFEAPSWGALRTAAGSGNTRIDYALQSADFNPNPPISLRAETHWNDGTVSYAIRGRGASTDLISGAFDRTTFSINHPLAIFALNNNGTIAKYTGTKIFRFEIFEYDVIVHNYVPCYRKLDSKPGMYDLVTKQFFINAGAGEFLVGPDAIDSISPLMVVWRRIMMAAASVAKKLVKLIATSTTSLVSFNTNVEIPVKVTCEFSPVQEGEGDPSPDNVRPISGWTGCEIHSGEFVTDDVGRLYVGGLSTIDGSPQNNLTNRVRSSAITVEAGKTYCIDSNIGFVSTRYYSTNSIEGYIGYDSYKQTPATFTVPNGAVTMRLVFAKDIVNYVAMTAEEVTKHDVYKADVTIPITFTDPSTGDPMTVYGGTATLNEDGSVDLVAQYRLVELKAWTTWSYNSSADAFQTGGQSNYDTDYPPICTVYKPGTSDYSITWTAQKRLIIRDRRYQNVTAWKTDMGDEFVCLRLAPSRFTAYHLSSIAQLNSFLETNHIWHNMNGDITIEYWEKQ